MGRHRNEADGLPERVALYHGAYYYRQKNGPKIHLGRDRSLALVKHAALLQQKLPAGGGLITHYIDRFLAETLPLAAPSTHRDLMRQFGNLRRAFGDMRPEQVEPTHIYEYMDRRAQPNEELGWKGAPVQANREVSQLSQLFRRLIKWGVVKANPCRDVDRFTEFARARAPAIDELEEFKAVASPVIQLYIDFKLMTGLRVGDILDLPRIPIEAEGFEVEYGKSRRLNRTTGKREGKRKLYVITPELREVIRQIHALPGRPDITQALFSTRKGKAYTRQGFRNLFQYHAQKAWKKGVAPFRDHDIRATVASLDPVNARARLGHSKQSTTDRYLRQIAVESIIPLTLPPTSPKTPNVAVLAVAYPAPKRAKPG